VLDASETAKLDALANALKDRPGLVLELTGSASVPLDRPALQAEALEADLRRARFAELQARWFGDKPETIDEVVLEPKDRRRLLERRYANSFGEKPRELFVPLLEVDVASGPSVAAVEDAQVAAWLEQLERSLASEIEIDTGTLRELARQRSQAVRDYMIEAGGIPAERIYMLDVAIEEAGQGDGPRAMLSLAAH